MLPQLALASFILLAPSLASAQTAQFQIEEATIEDIQAAILRARIDVDAGGAALLEPHQGLQRHVRESAGWRPRACTDHTDQERASAQRLDDFEFETRHKETLGFDPRKARSLTDSADADPAMPDALEVAAQQDAHFASTGRLIGPLHGVVLSIKDQYDTFDMRTTSGMDAAYANDRPPRDATFVKRLRDAGAILIAKANLGEMGTPNSRSSFGGPFCNPYDTERSPGTSSGGSGASVAANLVTCSIGEETGGSIHHPAKNNSIVGLAPTQELVSRDGMIGAALNTRVGPLCRTVKDTARVLEVIAGYDPKDELTAFSIGRLPAEPYRSFANERTLNGLRIGVIREHMDKRAFNEADGRNHRYRRARHRRSASIGRHDRRPGAGRSAPSELHRQVFAALSQPRVHRTVSGSLSRGRQRETVGRPHLSAGGHVFRSIARAFRHHDPEHRRGRQSA